MRTGAIFARGSCRALKWMALFGMVFVLGVGQADAQDTAAPTFESATFEPGGITVLITMSEPVYGGAIMGDFVLSGAGTGNSVTAVSMATDKISASREITVTVSAAIASGTNGATLVYTQPVAVGSSTVILARAIKDVSDNPAADNASITITETDLEPTLEKPSDENVVEKTQISPFVLTQATGGNGTGFSYTLFEGANDLSTVAGSTTSDLGLTFTPATRVVSGTPKMKGEYTLVYTATETGDGSAVGDAADVVPVVFTITVDAEGTTPTSDVPVKVKSVTAAASVAEGGSLEVTVTATVPAGEEVGGKVAPIASRMVKVTFPATIGTKIKKGEEAEREDFEPLGATNNAYEWKNIKRTDKASEQTFKFRVEIRRDLDAEDEKFQIAAQIDDDKPVATKDVLMIDDAQTQTYKLSLPTAAKGAITEGAEDATKVTLKADPARTMNVPVFMTMNPNDPARYSLTFSDDGMFGKDKTAVTATIKAMADKDRSEDMVTVTAYTGSPSNNMELASLDIKVIDANPLPAVRARLVDKDGKALDPQPMSVMEGETVMLMLTAVDKDGDSMKAAEKLSVSLMPAGTAGAMDYRLSAHPIEIASDSASSAAVDLMVLADDDVGEELLVFDAVVSGDEKVGPGSNSVMGVLSLMIEDGTMKLVWAKSMDEVQERIYDAKEMGAGADEIFSEGEMIEIDASTLFNYAEGVTLDYVASTDDDSVGVGTSGSMVTVTAMEAGMAHVTITAHANTPSGVKIVDQHEPDEASILFPVEVGLEALNIMLSGPEDMNVAEGMSATVTATANRAVTADTMVMLTRDRAMSSADDADYTVEAITIKAGEMMGSTMVMAVEDSMAEDMEELVLYGMTEGMAGEVTGEVKLYLWDAAVPALPVIAQLLLAAFLAVGGSRRYRRR